MLQCREKVQDNLEEAELEFIGNNRKGVRGMARTPELRCGFLGGESPFTRVCLSGRHRCRFDDFPERSHRVDRNVFPSVFSVSEIFRVALEVTWLEHDLIRS